jgi:hypothetical protein
MQLVNQIADSVIDGDVEYLRLKNGREIFSIFMESEVDKFGNVGINGNEKPA